MQGIVDRISTGHKSGALHCRATALGRPGDRLTSRRVSVVSDAKGLHDDWERRIVEIGDGRSVGELVAIIFDSLVKTRFEEVPAI